MDCPPRHRRPVFTVAAVAAVVLLGAPQWVAAGPSDADGSVGVGPAHLEPAGATTPPDAPAADPAATEVDPDHTAPAPTPDTTASTTTDTTGGAASAAPSSTSTSTVVPSAPVEPATETTPAPADTTEEPPVTDPTPDPHAFWPHDDRSPTGDDVPRTGVDDPATVTVLVDPAPGATRLVSIRTAAGEPVMTVTVTGEPLVFELEEGTFELFVEHLWDGGGTFLTRTPIATTPGRALTVACDADSLDCTVG